MNNSIEREACLNPSGWANYNPVAIIDKYRHPANQEEWDRYPNTDWEDVLFKKVRCLIMPVSMWRVVRKWSVTLPQRICE